MCEIRDTVFEGVFRIFKKSSGRVRESQFSDMLDLSPTLARDAHGLRVIRNARLASRKTKGGVDMNVVQGMRRFGHSYPRELDLFLFEGECFICDEGAIMTALRHGAQRAHGELRAPRSWHSEICYQ